MNLANYKSLTFTLASGLLGIFMNYTHASAIPEMSKERGYVEPFQMFDNLYYVGDQWVSSYLVTTNEGLILIDTLEYPYSKWLPINIKTLGFSPTDIKLTFITHAHSDHVGGAGYLQQEYDTQVFMSELDLALLDKQSKKHSFIKPTIRNFSEKQNNITLGQTQIKFHPTPGHTDSCTSLEFNVLSKGTPYRAFMVCGNGTNFKGKKLAESYLASVAKIKEIAKAHPQVTVNLATHPHLGQLFERKEKPATNTVVAGFLKVG